MPFRRGRGGFTLPKKELIVLRKTARNPAKKERRVIAEKNLGESPCPKRKKLTHFM